MASKLEGKVAVITGGSSGQGLATAERFLEEGAFVYTLHRGPSPMGDRVTAVQGDVSDLADLDRFYAKVASERGRIDIVFAAAGVVHAQPLSEMTEQSFDRQFAINTKGLAFTVQKALPLINDGGSIILVTSIAERRGLAGLGVYSATKAAVGSFVRTWTAELKDRGIRVNAICPGPIDTPIFEQVAPSKELVPRIKAEDAERVAFGRLGRPEEIAAAVLFLASDEGSFVAGVDLPVDGGLLAI
ncbi:SDR family NAD(P)-dependent oxidoreductase [Amycolatopsis sp. NPDC051903]|uniref:SDR family NAD(P)-dependent oxidoreductase n=1 Tax=Amycolatopsis sp. NPDC051903 TaxID=3363936 RepID=UPI00378DAE2F